jgi:hypothetical protein
LLAYNLFTKEMTQSRKYVGTSELPLVGALLRLTPIVLPNHHVNAKTEEGTSFYLQTDTSPDDVEYIREVRLRLSDIYVTGIQFVTTLKTSPWYIESASIPSLIHFFIFLFLFTMYSVSLFS